MDIVYYSKSLSVGSGEIKKNWKSVTVESDLQLLDFRIFDERKDEALPERVQVADDQRRKKTSSSDDVGDSCDGPII